MLRVKHLQTENPRQEKIAEILELLKLGFMERRTAESYLRGEHGEVALKGYLTTIMRRNGTGRRTGFLDSYMRCMALPWRTALSPPIPVSGMP